jgi:hypothetical protein
LRSLEQLMPKSEGPGGEFGGIVQTTAELATDQPSIDDRDRR